MRATIAARRAREGAGARTIGARSPWGPCALVLLVYALWAIVQLPMSRGGLLFADAGDAFLHQSRASAAIDAIPTISGDPRFTGYDGQFVYYIALDPINARRYMDWPAYRYTRILYPALARAVTLGRAALIPYALVAINWLAIGGGTLAVAAWLRRKGVSPWYAAIYGFYPGFFISLRFDLTEPLGYGLAAAAMYAFDYGGRRRAPIAALLFAAATLARESSALFGIACGLALLPWGARSAREVLAERSKVRRALLFLAIAVAPLACYKAVLYRALGSGGYRAELAPTAIPFGGLLTWYSTLWPLKQAIHVALPGSVCLLIAIRALRQGRRDVQVWLLALHAALFTVFLNAASYKWFEDPVRIAAGVPLAALFALPAIDRSTGGDRLWLLACALLWLWPLAPWLLQPIDRYYFLW